MNDTLISIQELERCMKELPDPSTFPHKFTSVTRQRPQLVHPPDTQPTFSPESSHLVFARCLIYKGNVPRWQWVLESNILISFDEDHEAKAR